MGRISEYEWEGVEGVVRLPSDFVCIPMFGSKGSGILISVGNRFSTRLAGDASSLKVLGG
jgi:hypothetical protein